MGVKKIVFEENNPGIWEYSKDGDTLEGVLISIQKEVGPTKSMLYTLETKEGILSAWGSAILDQRMMGIKVGNVIQIVYKGLGEAQAGKNAPKIFKVLVDKEPSVEPTAPVDSPDSE